MELKKYPDKDVRRRTDIHFMIGLVLALGVTYTAFSINKGPEETATLAAPPSNQEIEEVMDITKQEQPKQQAPPPETIEIKAEDDESTDPLTTNQELNQDAVIPDAPQQVNLPTKTEEPETFMVVEEMPSFPGGEKAMMAFIADNLEYPPMARENGIEGRVVVKFVVDENGRVGEVELLKGLGWGCDEAAIKVIKNMPRWTPGKQRGKPVRVMYNMPIRFQLQ